jgi:von Willebrand factor type A domain
MRLHRAATSGIVAVLTLIGCGSSGESTFGDGSGNSSGGSGNPLPTFGGVVDGGEADGPVVGNVGGVTPGSACATSSAGSTRPPTYLVVMYDRSISMGDSVGSTTKWAACKTALEAFFAAPSSAGIHASLTFFGKDASSSTADCSASSYVTPQVAMGALPNATSYANAINGTSPSTDTPTVAAEQGAIQYAQQIKTGLKPNEKIAIVLVTDGDPLFCGSGNTVTAVANAASSVASTIPTYVVGIGSSLTNLNTIAKAGGTTAILVSTSTPSQLTADLEKALGSIASAQLGCSYPFPSPPAGQTLNVNAVNVDYTPSGGAQATLNYSGDCSDANGWHYDSTTAPTQIVMCPSLCTTLKGDPGGKIDIIFGCSTTVPPGGSPPVR